jgi:outer membrane protein assembly factor BamB
MSTRSAEVVKEHHPFGEERVHGVTFDGERVWFARDGEVVAFDPKTEEIVARHVVPGASAGTAFDGEHLYQLAGSEILVLRREDGAVVRRMPAPGKGKDTGMAYADGHLFVGHWSDTVIRKVDAKTGEVVKELRSDRFVTGVSCIDGALWHGAVGGDKPCELRRLGEDGSVEEVLTVPVEMIAGIEAVGDGTFWCAGEKGALRLVRRRDA